MGSAIIGCGKALPALEVDNAALEALVDTNDEWIVTRTGISSRHVAVQESAEDLAAAAARTALGWESDDVDGVRGQGWSERSIDPESIDLIVYATITPDALVPSAAGLLRKRLGLNHAIAFDVNAACTGFIYGLTVAESMMAASAPKADGAARRNPIRRALVVGAERLTRVTNWKDRNTCVLFGDGAGAAVLEWDEARGGILGTFITNEDDVSNALTCPLSFDVPQPFDRQGVAPNSATTVDGASTRIDETLGLAETGTDGESEPRQTLRMDGRRVFKFAAEAMNEAVNRVLERAGVSLDEVACIVPHQANERIIKYAAKKLDRPMDFFQLSIAHTGNTSSASVPMALADARTTGRIKSGDKVVLVAFGGGFTSGAVLFEA